jgi:hypothetical protein
MVGFFLLTETYRPTAIMYPAQTYIKSESMDFKYLFFIPFLETKSTLNPIISSRSSAKSMNLIPMLSENSTTISKHLILFALFGNKNQKLPLI